MAAYITVGAKTTHGGTVISGSLHTTHNGIPVARVGDKVMCKKCKKVVTIATGDPSYIVDGSPIARGGDLTSGGSKLIAIQQSFCESDFDVMGIAQAAPLVFPKSDMSNSFTGDNEEDLVGSIIAGNTVVGEPDQGGGGGDTLINSSDIDKTIEELRRAEFREASEGFSNPSSRPYNPQPAYSDEDLKRLARVYGEQSETGQFATDAMGDRGVMPTYRDEQQQIEQSRVDNIAARSERALNQQRLEIRDTPPPPLDGGLDYENPMTKARDGWKGELADGGKQAGTAIYGIAKDSHAGFNAIATTGENLLNKDTDALKGQAVDKVKDTGKGKLIDKAKDVAPKPVKGAWDAYDNYQEGKEKFEEIKDARPKD